MTSYWLTPVDQYCERIDASFWSEPVNALTNGAFLIAAAWAFVLWRKASGRDWPVLWLIIVTGVVGIGSFLFHTVANRWSLLADVLPIAVFIYSYFMLAMRRYLRLGTAAAIGTTALFVAFNLGFERLWRMAFPEITLNGSVGYLPAGFALVAVGGLCMGRPGRAEAGRGLVLAAAIFTLSLFFRSLDEAVCRAMPIGTHFLWHSLNAVVLYILIRLASAVGAEKPLALRGADRGFVGRA